MVGHRGRITEILERGYREGARLFSSKASGVWVVFAHIVGPVGGLKFPESVIPNRTGAFRALTWNPTTPVTGWN